VDMPDPGTAYDLHWPQYTVPAWMSVCTVAPYLIKDGTVYSASTYPGLFAILGATFGGNGVTTFAVPDERSRFRIGVDPGSTARVTGAGCGINGAQPGAVGGSQFMQTHSHANTLSDP